MELKDKMEAEYHNLMMILLCAGPVLMFRKFIFRMVLRLAMLALVLGAGSAWAVNYVMS